MPGRGRMPTYEEMKEELREDGKLDWHKTIVFRKKSSVYHTLIRGRCYTKIIVHKIFSPSRFGNYAFQRLYATHEEMFRHILEHGQ